MGVAPIAWQLRELEPTFRLDAIFTVIDCVNFRGYEDTSYTAKLQAQYTDLLLLNKHELVSERELDLLMDHINELNTDTPKLLMHKDEGLEPSVVFGLEPSRMDWAAISLEHIVNRDQLHHQREIDLLHIEDTTDSPPIDMERLQQQLPSVSKEDVYRIKGFVQASDGVWIINWAFGRMQVTRLDKQSDMSGRVLVSVMGRDLGMYTAMFARIFQVNEDCIVYSKRLE
jgi:G3E family GTPase